MGVAVTFIAILELLREGLLEIVQNGAFAPIHICAADPTRTAAARVIDGTAEEASAADARLLAESEAAAEEDETDEPDQDDEAPPT